MKKKIHPAVLLHVFFCIKSFSLLVALLIVFSTSGVSYSQSPDQLEGAKYFKQFCTTCHTVGGGRLVGPDLAGVTNKRDEEWLVKFIKSSQTVIKSGDPQAVAIYEEYGKMIMPDPPFTEAQVREIVKYLKAVDNVGDSGGTGSVSQKTQDVSETEKYTQDDVFTGQRLFIGKEGFEKRGPACISCHDVDPSPDVWGGTLAKDLSDVFSRLGGSGIVAILRNPPFPVMQGAYKGRLLTEKEIKALLAFLEDVDKQNRVVLSKDYKKFVASGVGGLFFLMLAYSFMWHDRKEDTVYRRVFKRQTKSE